MTDSRQAHWDKVYSTKAVTDASWYEAHPAKSLELILATGVTPAEAIIDVGGGASFLVDALLNAGYRDLTVLDISTEVLQKLRERLSTRAASVALIQADVTTFQPTRHYALWHDRAVFHFLVEREDRERYVASLRRALLPNGHAIISTFGPSGPDRCSGLPIARYDASALTAELGSDFALASSSLAVHRTPLGAEQQFLHCHFTRRLPPGD
jgi:SAM-dependent methyltransferase